jgi:hypothetical protein
MLPSIIYHSTPYLLETPLLLELAADMRTLLKIHEDNDSVKGSDCKFETCQKFGFGPLPPQLIRGTLIYTPKPKIFARLASAVLLFTQKMIVCDRFGFQDEVKYVQPRFQQLLKKLVAIMGMSTSVHVLYKRGSNAVKYRSREYGIHGEMDAGVFLPDTAICLLPVEVKNLKEELTWKWITQCAGEMAGKLEALQSGYDLIPRLYCGILVSGRRWVVLFRRYTTAGARLWQHTTELSTFNDAGEIDYRSLFKVVMLLHHSLLVTTKVLDEISATTLKQSSEHENRGEDYVGRDAKPGRSDSFDTDKTGDGRDSIGERTEGHFSGRERGGGGGGYMTTLGKDNVGYGIVTDENMKTLNHLQSIKLSVVDSFVRRDY